MTLLVSDSVEVRPIDSVGGEVRLDAIEFNSGGQTFRFEDPENAAAASATTPVSRREIISAGSTARLKQIYKEHGYEFSSDEEFTRQVKKDWDEVLIAARDFVPGVLEFRGELQPLSFEVNDLSVDIYGAVHGERGKTFVSDLEAALGGPGPWYIEEALIQSLENDSLRNSLRRKAVEIHDRAAESPWTRASHGAGLSGLLRLFADDPELDFRAGLPSPLTNRQQDLVALFLSLHCQGELPPYMLVEGSLTRGHSPFLETTRDRSALIALFTLNVAQRLDQEEVKILCGYGHAPEIEFFMRNPDKAPDRIQALAREQVELFLKDREDYSCNMRSAAMLYEVMPGFALPGLALLMAGSILYFTRKRPITQSDKLQDGSAA